MIDPRRLEQSRQRAELSYEELGERVGVKRQTMEKICKDGMTSIVTLAMLAKTLGVSADWLLGLSSDPGNGQVLYVLINGQRYVREEADA